MIDERINKPLEWLWNTVCAYNNFIETKVYNTLKNMNINLNKNFKFPFPNYTPHISLVRLFSIGKKEINECRRFYEKNCSVCKNPDVICIIEDFNNFLRYKKLKECMKKDSSKEPVREIMQDCLDAYL